jgi:hypothetical protein
MKKIFYIAVVVTALVFATAGCDKGKEVADNNNVISKSKITKDYSMGELHNKLCANIITQGKDSAYFKPSTKSILNWIDISEKYLNKLYPAETRNIQNACKMAKEYFLSFPDDKNGINELFSKEIYDRQFVEKFHKNSDIPKELSYLIQKMHNCLLEPKFNQKELDNYLLKIQNLPDNSYKEAFLDVYKSSAYFWKNEANELPCYSKPPKGWSDEAWVSLCDAIGGTAGFVATGWAGWIVGTVVATVVSTSVSRELSKK